MIGFELLLISQGLRQLGIVYISFIFYSLKSCLRLEVNYNKNECKFCLWSCNCVHVTGAIILLLRCTDVLLDL